MVAQRGLDEHEVGNVALDELVGNTRERFQIAGVRERVEHDDRVVGTIRRAPTYEVRTDETGASGDEQLHVRSGDTGRSAPERSARLGLAWSRADSSGSVRPQSPAISGS